MEKAKKLVRNLNYIKLRTPLYGNADDNLFECLALVKLALENIR